MAYEPNAELFKAAAAAEANEDYDTALKRITQLMEAAPPGNAQLHVRRSAVNLHLDNLDDALADAEKVGGCCKLNTV